MTRRSLFKSVAAAFAGSVLARTALAGAEPPAATSETEALTEATHLFQATVYKDDDEWVALLKQYDPEEPGPPYETVGFFGVYRGAL